MFPYMTYATLNLSVLLRQIRFVPFRGTWNRI